MTNRGRTLTMISLVAALIQPVAGAEPAAGEGAVLDRALAFVPAVAARCGDAELTAGQVRRAVRPRLSLLLSRAEAAGKPLTATALADKARQFARAAAEQFVDQQLLLAVALRAGHALDLDAAAERARRQFAEIQRQLGAEALAQNLAAQNVTEAEAIADLARQLAEQAAFTAWVEASVRPAHRVTAAEARKFYRDNQGRFRVPERVRAAHILVKINPGASPAERAAARARIEAVQEELKKPGADFAALARVYSECPSAPRGGDLGPLTRGSTSPEFERVAWALGADEISGIVETEHGLHIIRGGRHEPARQQTFAQVQDRLVRDLEQRRVNETLRAAARRARDTAQVEILLPE